MPIALLTDFGTKEYYVGAMKGSILSINPQANIIDITHEIAPQNVLSAAFTLRACYQDFPAGTIFVCVVDPGDGSSRRPIALEAHDRVFVAPDNGLLGLVIRDDAAKQVSEISNRRYMRENVSSTFHGRDIFAPAAAYLSTGISVKDLGAPVANIVSLDLPLPGTNSDGTITAELIHVDRFGNLVTNLQPSHLGEDFVVEIDGHTITELKTAYAEATSDEPILINGSTGFIEISCRNTSAARYLDLSVGTRIRVINDRQKA